MTWMKLNKTISRDDRFTVVSCFVLSIGRHQLTFGGPDRIGMLTFHFLECLGRGGIALLDHLIHGLVVEIVDRLLDIGVLLSAAARSQRSDQRGHAEPAKDG